MRIVVIGAGPIGGIVGGRLARAGKDVTLVDVDVEHLRAIAERGLRVDVPDGAFNVSVPAILPGEMEGKFDVGLVAVRSNYTLNAITLVVHHFDPDGVLVSLQNGLNPPLIEEIVGPDRTIGAVVRMRSLKVAPGHVRTGSEGRLFIGHLHGKETTALKTVHALLHSVIPTEITDNIRGVLWSKLSYTCLGMLTSLTGEPLRTVCADEVSRRLCVALLGEVTQVGGATGVQFEPLAEYHPADFYPSHALEDRFAAFDAAAAIGIAREDRDAVPHLLQAGVTTHVEFTVGHVVRDGRRAGVPTPLCEALGGMIHEIEDGKRHLGMQNYAELAGFVS